MSRTATRAASAFVSAAEGLEALGRGEFLVVADTERPDSDADVMIAAEFASSEAVNFLAAEARGVIYLGLSDERCEALNLWPMAHGSEPRRGWKSAFMVMIDARVGISTGISAPDRARTIAAAIDPASGPDALVRPGHIVPLRAAPNGVLERAGRTESFVDLPRMAGLLPAGAASCVMTDEGALATVADLVPWCERHGIRMVTVEAVAAEAVRRLPWLQVTAERTLDTAHGPLDAVVLAEPRTGAEHVVVLGRERGRRPARLAVFGQCVAGHVLGDRGCPDRAALDATLAALAGGEADLLVHVGLPGLCCGEPAVATAADGSGPVTSRPWAVVAKALRTLGVTDVEPDAALARRWSELERYGISLAGSSANAVRSGAGW